MSGADYSDLDGHYSRVGAHYDGKGKDDLNYLSSSDGLIVHHHTGTFPLDAAPVVPASEDELLRVLGASEDRLVHFGARMLGLQKGEHGLDCGCGRGGSSFLFCRDYGVSTDGITVSQSQYAFATDAATRLGLDAAARFYLENLYDGGRPTSAYEFIWACESTEYMHDKAELFRQWNRILKPGGRALAIFISYARSRHDEVADDLQALYRIYAGYPDAMDSYFHAAQQAGFSIDDVVGLEHETLPYWRLRLGSKNARGSEQILIRCLESGALHFSAVLFRKP